MEEYKKAIEEFRRMLTSLGPECQDIKDQGIEILDNPEGENGVLSVEQYDRLMSLLEIGEDDLKNQIDELTEENEVLENFVKKMEKEGNLFNQNMDSLVQDMQESNDSTTSSQ